MKKIFRTVAALAVVMFAGCTNDLTNDVVAPVGEGTTVTLGLDTKTSLGELVDGSRKVYWSAGDQININGDTSKEAVIDAENAGLATFSFGKILNTPYSILYPAEDYKDASTITLPAVQAAASGSFGVDAAPMAAYVTAVGETPSLHHLTAVVRLQLKAAVDGDTHDIYKVEFRGGGNEQVSGDFAINYQTATLTSASTAVADQVVVAEVKKSLSTDKATDVFIVVPAQEYAGFTVRIVDKYGHFMEKSSTATIELAKGQIVAMPEFPFEPTGTDVNINITSAAELVAFANDYNAGLYDNVDPLVVEVKNDIVFDDAANTAWADVHPIGGKFTVDGEEVNRYFHGSFNGGNFAIKNWKTNKALFGYTGAASTIYDLTIDSSCTLTAVPAGAVSDLYYGGFVGYHKGELNNCHNNATVAVSGAWDEGRASIGGLVGRIVEGSVIDCSMGGDMSADITFLTSNKEVDFGGVIGRMSNADGSAKNSYMYGAITYRGGSTYVTSHANDGTVYFGGFVGNCSGKCENCHVYNETANAKRILIGNFDYLQDSGSKVVLAQNHYRWLHIGGVAGYVGENATVKDCTNNLEIFIAHAAGSDASRYLNMGGIAGSVDGKVTGCTNSGNITNRAECLQQTFGGIVAVANDTATISDSSSEGTQLWAASSTVSGGYKMARNLRFGGVIGLNHSLNVSNVSNSAKVRVSSLNANSTSTAMVGGIFGYTDAVGTINGNSLITNSGEVEFTAAQSYIYAAGSDGEVNDIAYKYCTVGGIAGLAVTNLSNVLNDGLVEFIANGHVHRNIYVGGILGLAAGNITLDTVTNNGKVLFDTSTSELLHYNICVGGILGSDCYETEVNDKGETVAVAGAAVAAATVSNAVNNGIVGSSGTSTNSVYRSMAVGGIVGALTNTDSSLNGCINLGGVGNNVGNNNCTSFAFRTEANGAIYVGGIAGYVQGAEGKLISITGCKQGPTTNSIDFVNTSYNVYALRGLLGGLVAYANYADIKNCECTTTVYLTNSTRIAGLVTILLNSNLEGCQLLGSTLQTKTANGSGGLAAYVENSTVKSNIIGNTSIKTTGAVTKHGVLAGISDAASTFTGNKVSGTFQDAEITLSSTMIGSGSPTVTGTTLYE